MQDFCYFVGKGSSKYKSKAAVCRKVGSRAKKFDHCLIVVKHWAWMSTGLDARHFLLLMHECKCSKVPCLIKR